MKSLTGKNVHPEILDALRMYGRLAMGLPGFLRKTLSSAEARSQVEDRLRRREENFLDVVEKAVYGCPRSPYLRLLKASGCEWGDLKTLVRQNGLEGALGELRQSGVYVSLEEFKGRREAKRGSETFHFTVEDFDNPHLEHHFEARSGGTRSGGTRMMLNLDFISAMAADNAVLFDVHRLWTGRHGIWFPESGSTLVLLLYMARVGQTPVKWFSQVDIRAARVSFKYHAGISLLLAYARLLGRALPSPEFRPVQEAERVAAWMAETIKADGGCTLTTLTSTATRVCVEAKKKGFDFRGASFVMGGEALTSTKRREIESSGAKAIPVYAFHEGSIAAFACGTPEASDDMHFLTDKLAVIETPREIALGSIRVPVLFFTSLLPNAPKILFNVEGGDYGLLEKRGCGCLFGELGLSTHLSGVASFEKLTSEGVTFVGTDLIRIIEEVLPSRFGGSGSDYQVVEEEGADGLPQLFLVVSPAVGEVNEREVIQAFLGELGKKSEAQKIMAEMLAQTSVRVRRIQPLATRAGKVLPFHLLAHHEQSGTVTGLALDKAEPKGV